MLGLRKKLLIPTLVGFLGFVSLVQFYWAPSLLESKRLSLVEQGQAILGNISFEVVRLILSGDLAALHANLDDVMDFHGVNWHSLAVVDDQSRRIYPLSKPADADGEHQISLERILVWDGSYLGKMSLVLDLESALQGEKERIRNVNLVAIFIFSLIAMGGIIWSNMFIRKPVLSLSHAASRLAQGDYTADLPRPGKDEFGDLIRAFGSMRNNLFDTGKMLQETLDTVTENEVHQRTLLNHIMDGVFTIDGNGCIGSFNSSAEKMFGYDREEVAGKKSSILIEHEDADAFFSSSKLLSNVGRRIEAQGMKSNGDSFPMEICVNEMYIHGEMMFTAIVRDITQRRYIDKMKDEFISIVSHELRTPLTSISGAISLVRSGHAGKVNTKIKDLLVIAANNSERLLYIINDLLDLQKIGAGEMDYHFTEVEICPLLERAIKDSAVYARHNNVRLEFVSNIDDAYVYADSQRLLQAINNLASNAVKFSPDDDVIKIAAYREAGMIRLSFSDHGPGIPKTFQDKVFDKFTQSDSTVTRDKGGTGLGLAIAKSIVERHAGKITFVSEDGQGTTFFVDLPEISAGKSHDREIAC